MSTPKKGKVPKDVKKASNEEKEKSERSESESDNDSDERDEDNEDMVPDAGDDEDNEDEICIVEEEARVKGEDRKASIRDLEVKVEAPSKSSSKSARL